jgi:hypothetical protein
MQKLGCPRTLEYQTLSPIDLLLPLFSMVGMKLARKEGMMWHFAEMNHCGWAQTFDEKNSFDETREVESIDGVGNFCSMCRERREEE